MSVTPHIFKAYDVRGLYPSEINEDAARLIGRAFVSYLGARRIAVGRDMRLSSPSVAAAFIEGARDQGADVVDYGMMATDMVYFAVARDGHDGGAQITASHNPKEYNGIKMVRREAFPLSGDAGIGEIREMVTTGSLPPAAATKGSLTREDVLDDYVDHVLSFIDEKAVGQNEPYFRVRLRTKTNQLGTPSRPLRIAPGMVVTADILTGDRTVLTYLTKPIFKALGSSLGER